MIYPIKLCDRELTYELVRKNVKNVNLRVHPDGRITVSASRSVPRELIEKFIISKEEMIVSAIERFSDRKTDANEIRLFGELLREHRIESKRNYFQRNGSDLFLFLKDTDSEDGREKVIDSFMRSELEKKLSEVSDGIYDRFACYEFDFPTVKLRKMSTRWGSCNASKATVTLNIKLAAYPVECLEFVLCHELCHMVYPNHSPDFYNLLTTLMPDWQERRKVLNGK